MTCDVHKTYIISYIFTIDILYKKLYRNTHTAAFYLHTQTHFPNAKDESVNIGRQRIYISYI